MTCCSKERSFSSQVLLEYDLAEDLLQCTVTG